MKTRVKRKSYSPTSLQENGFFAAPREQKMFQTRPFSVQAKPEPPSKPKSLQEQLIRAAKYGHNLSKVKFNYEPQQTSTIQSKSDRTNQTDRQIPIIAHHHPPDIQLKPPKGKQKSQQPQKPESSGGASTRTTDKLRYRSKPTYAKVENEAKYRMAQMIIDTSTDKAFVHISRDATSKEQQSKYTGKQQEGATDLGNNPGQGNQSFIRGVGTHITLEAKYADALQTLVHFADFDTSYLKAKDAKKSTIGYDFANLNFYPPQEKADIKPQTPQRTIFEYIENTATQALQELKRQFKASGGKTKENIEYFTLLTDAVKKLRDKTLEATKQLIESTPYLRDNRENLVHVKGKVWQELTTQENITTAQGENYQNWQQERKAWQDQQKPRH